jgi:hypothetical protein
MEPGQSAQLVPIQIRLIWFTNLIARAVREANSVSRGPASLVEIAIQVISVLEDQTQTAPAASLSRPMLPMVSVQRASTVPLVLDVLYLAILALMLKSMDYLNAEAVLTPSTKIKQARPTATSHAPQDSIASRDLTSVAPMKDQRVLERSVPKDIIV